MKRTIAILLTLLLVLGLSTTAFAADAANLIIEDDSGTVRTFEGYQLLNLTVSLKSGEHHPATCDGNHTDDCYNYAYTVNNKYLAILQSEVYGNAGTGIWGAEGKPASSASVTEDQILEYLSIQTGDNGGEFGTLRRVADRLYRAIQTAGITADKTDMSGNADVIGQGYWLIADVTDLNGQHDANSLVMLDTNGASAITVKPKVAIPTVEKKVKDIDDSEDANILDNPWYDAADHDIGDSVPFKLTGTMPSNARAYNTFKMVFHDTLSAGLTLKPGTIKVLMYANKYSADVDTDLNDSMRDVTEHFDIKTTGLTDNCTFEVSCDNVMAINGASRDTAFVVYYEATLNESAVMGAAGNPNEVYLEFSNDAYGDGIGETEKDEVVVFTYQMKVNKTDSHGHALEGAGFTLYKKNLAGEFVQIGETLSGKDMTTFSWQGLDDGDYKLVETIVPDGYNKMDDIVFAISAGHSETADDPELLSLDGGNMGTGVVETGMIEKNIENHTGTALPETGAKGTAWLILAGTMFVGVAAIFMVTRKKMSIYED